jgi:hypothetical protein
MDSEGAEGLQRLKLEPPLKALVKRVLRRDANGEGGGAARPSESAPHWHAVLSSCPPAGRRTGQSRGNGKSRASARSQRCCGRGLRPQRPSASAALAPSAPAGTLIMVIANAILARLGGKSNLRRATVPTFSTVTVILTFGILNVASHNTIMKGSPSRTVLVPCPSSQRASHALLLLNTTRVC